MSEWTEFQIYFNVVLPIGITAVITAYVVVTGWLDRRR